MEDFQVDRFCYSQLLQRYGIPIEWDSQENTRGEGEEEEEVNGDDYDDVQEDEEMLEDDYDDFQEVNGDDYDDFQEVNGGDEEMLDRPSEENEVKEGPDRMFERIHLLPVLGKASLCPIHLGNTETTIQNCAIRILSSFNNKYVNHVIIKIIIELEFYGRS